MDASPRKRIRRDPETARQLILDLAEKLMLDEGYAAVSTRRVAKEGELAPALVHYYYPTTDDLFIALHRRMMDRQIEPLRQALDTANPLQALWEFQTNWAQAALGVEFMALANHRKSIRQEIARRTEQAREAQAEILRKRLPVAAPIAQRCSAECLATLLQGVARTLANEQAVGISHGHDEVRAFVDWAVLEFGSPGADEDAVHERT